MILITKLCNIFHPSKMRRGRSINWNWTPQFSCRVIYYKLTNFHATYFHVQRLDFVENFQVDIITIINLAAMDSTIHRVSCMARAVATPTIRPATAMAIQAITTRATTHRQPVATTIHHTDTTTTKMRTMDTTADTTTAPTEHIPTVTLQATTIKIANESSVCHIIKDTHNNTTPMDTSIDYEKNIVKSFSKNTQTHTHNSPPKKTDHRKNHHSFVANK